MNTGIGEMAGLEEQPQSGSFQSHTWGQLYLSKRINKIKQMSTRTNNMKRTTEEIMVDYKYIFSSILI